MPTSLRARLLALLVLAALPVAIAMLGDAFQMRAAARSDAERDLLSITRDIVATHAQTRAVAQQSLRMLSRIPEVTAGDPEACRGVLAPIVQADPRFFNLGVYEVDGSIRCRGRGPATSVNLADRPHFQHSLQAREFVASEFHMGRVTGEPSQVFVLPVAGEDGRPRALLYANWLLATFVENVRGADFPADVRITLVDPAFNVLVRSPPDQAVGRSMAGSKMQQVLAANGTRPAVYSFAVLDSEKRLHAVTGIREGDDVLGYALVSVPEARVMAPANRALARELGVLALVLAAMWVIVFFGANAVVLKRVSALVRATRKVAAGDLAARVPAARDANEFSVLENAFNDMAEKNQQALENIARLNRVYAVLTAINGAIVHLREQGALANEACRIAVETGGYVAAYLFLVEPGTRHARLVGQAGPEEAYYAGLTIEVDQPPMPDDGPMRRALKTGTHAIERVPEAPGENEPRRRYLARSAKFNARVLAAFPLGIQGQTFGVLQLWSSREDAFDDEEVQLLTQLASDIGLGLEHIEREARLEENETRFRETFNQAAVGIAHVSPEGRILRVNQKYADIVGYPRDELVGMTPQALTYPADRAVDMPPRARLLRGELTHFEQDKRYLRKDGVIVWGHLTMSLVREADGTPRYLVAVVEDISLRKEAEQSLRNAELRYRELFATNPNPMFVYDVEALRMLAVNDAALQLYGYSREAFCALALEDLPVPEEVPAMLERVKRLPPGLASVGLRRDRRRDGTVIEVETESSPLDFAGHRARVVVVHDVTERRRTASALREAEEKYRSLVEQSLMGSYILDIDRVHYANARAAEIFGYGQQEITTVPLRALVLEEDWPIVESHVQRRIAATVSGLPYEFRGRRKDGSIVQVGAHGRVTSVGGQRRVVGVLQDIGEKLRDQAQIADYVQRLERAVAGTVDAISRMVELRDPYTSGHERRVGELAAAIGAELGLDANAQRGLRITGAVHDIGKITVPAEILSKPGRLSAAEFAMVQGHAEQGYEILKSVDFPWPVAETVLQHHERLDGSGYPKGLKGEAIRMEARILAVADVVEAMASHRPYRPAVGIEKALAEIERGRATLYDADAVDACLRLYREQGFQLPD